MSLPKRVVVEYEDGTRREGPFSSLSRQGQMELCAAGLCEFPVPAAAGSYVLLQWNDGWKEVVATDSRAVELLRYYTIERVDRVGRLSMEVEDANPQLLFVRRLADKVKSILFVGKDRVKTYSLKETTDLKEGGKIERIFYDKKKAAFGVEEASGQSAVLDDLLADLKRELGNRGLSPSAALSRDETQVPLYKELARALGLRGTERQHDVYGFLRLAIEKLEQQNR